MLIELGISTLLHELVRKLFVRGPRNNVNRIKQYYLHETPEIQNVGDLRRILKDFADDVPFESVSDNSYLVFQTREVNGVGVCHIGKGERFEFPPRRR